MVKKSRRKVYAYFQIREKAKRENERGEGASLG